MNSVNLFGRICSDITIRVSANGVKCALFSVAVSKKVRPDGNAAEFIDCVAFKQKAELIEKYYDKGDRILLEGSLATSSYMNKNGFRVKKTSVIIEQMHFIDTKAEREARRKGDGSTSEPSRNPEDFMDIDETAADFLPFD